MVTQKYEQGQILLIVVLVMVTVLTIGLSVAARSVTNLRTTKEEDNSERAFSAAEAGIEKSITTNLGSSGAFTNSATYQTTVTALSGTQVSLNNGISILKDQASDLWLSTYPSYANPWTGNVTFYWGQAGNACSTSESINTLAALEIVLISGSKAAPQITHYAVDPCPPRAASNNFQSITQGGGTINGKTYLYKRSIAVNSGLLIRIIPLYSSAVIGIAGCDINNNNCNALPSQGTVIQSVGTSDNTKRKIISYRGYPKIPTELFPFILFAPK